MLPIIAALQKDTDEHLREAVRQAALSSSWSEIAAALGAAQSRARRDELATQLRTAVRALKDQA